MKAKIGKNPAKKKGGGKKKQKVSDIKRNNQRYNKLVKQGKVKPKIKQQYLDHLPKKNKPVEVVKEKKKLSTTEQQERAAETDRQRDEALEELAADMSGDEVEALKKISRKRKFLGGIDELKDLEEGALTRIHQGQEDNPKKLRHMLPIKTKSGWKEQTIEVDETVQNSDGEDRESVGEIAESEDEEIEEDVVVPGEQVSVVELYARRKELLKEKKLLIGSLASAFLEDPRERISNLENLVKLVDADQPESIRISVQRLAAASVLEVLKDVTPGYKIIHQDTGRNRLKKETYHLQQYEQAILKYYKSYLVKLEKLVNIFKASKRKQPKDVLVIKQAEFFVTCMCTLLLEHPYFNFTKNIMHAIIPILDSHHTGARTVVKQAVEQLLKGDMKGELSLEATRLINHLVKSRKHDVKIDVVDVLRSLRIKSVNLDKEKEEEINTKKKEARRQKLMEKNHISRQEKKRKKKLEVLNRELLEAKGEESKEVKQKFFTEATKIVFTIYFRVLKSFPRSNLIGSVLEGLAKFAHVINIEFFSDLISVFAAFLKADFLSHRDSLLVVSAVFTILSGQGESLNIDPASFYTHLYNLLFNIEPFKTHDDVPLVMQSMDNMIIKRRKKVSTARVLAFAKRLSTLALQLLHNGAASSLALLREIVNTHTVTAQLLDSQHEVGSGLFDPSIENPEHCSASNTTAWELATLSNHYHPPTAKLAEHIIAQCPVTGVHAVQQELKKPPQEIFQDFSMDDMAFNPTIRPPGKNKKKLSTPVSFSVDMNKFKQCDDPDFFAAVKKTVK